MGMILHLIVVDDTGVVLGEGGGYLSRYDMSSLGLSPWLDVKCDTFCMLVIGAIRDLVVYSAPKWTYVCQKEVISLP